MIKAHQILRRLPFHWTEFRRLAALALVSAPYVRPGKLLNMIHCEWDKLRRRVKPRSRPYIAIVDPVNVCPLRCPYCPTGSQRNSGRGRGLLDAGLITPLLEEWGRYLISVNLFNWGEPLLHPDLPEIISLFHSRGICTVVSSNLNIRTPDRLERLGPAGLDYLIVSVSGATQETYQKYHRRGALDLVRANIRHLIEHRRSAGLGRPLVEMKYLLFNYNQGELEAARELAREAGADVFRVVEAGGPAQVVRQGRNVSREGFEINLCHHLWQSVTVNADGAVPPCCYTFFKEDDFGHLLTDRPRDLRCNDLFVTARKLFNPVSSRDLPLDLRHPCLKCHMVHRQRHLREYLRNNPHAKMGHRTGGD